MDDVQLGDEIEEPEPEWPTALALFELFGTSGASGSAGVEEV
jgi:hypothetical protein